MIYVGPVVMANIVHDMEIGFQNVGNVIHLMMSLVPMRMVSTTVVNVIITSTRMETVLLIPVKPVTPTKNQMFPQSIVQAVVPRTVRSMLFKEKELSKLQISRVTSDYISTECCNRMEQLKMQQISTQHKRPGGEKIPPGGWRSTEQVMSDEQIERLIETGYGGEYRTRDGRAYFTFHFVHIDNSYYEVDIIRMPCYGARNRGAHETHRLGSRNGGKKICFGDERAISTLEIAREFAAAWAENTWNYILTGARF